MFRKLHAPRARVTILVDDRRLVVDAADTVAAALLGAGITRFRASAVKAMPRAPYCLMGACFECLVEIDDQPQRQACLVPVAEGMRIRTEA
jgi:NADH dehydrogenase/NADH:ubiquinone oxidoreductase subunit G